MTTIQQNYNPNPKYSNRPSSIQFQNPAARRRAELNLIYAASYETLKISNQEKNGTPQLPKL
jgi:hypothetical protein